MILRSKFKNLCQNCQKCGILCILTLPREI
jgi:hypothetical protein